MKAARPRNRTMDKSVASQRQKAVQAWVKLRAKREAAATAKPLKHGKKTST
jgi:hypothetical protein